MALSCIDGLPVSSEFRHHSLVRSPQWVVAALSLVEGLAIVLEIGVRLGRLCGVVEDYS